MEKSKKTKTTQEGSQKDSLNKASGLVYWDDYDFAAAYLENMNLSYSTTIMLKYDHDNDGSSDL